MKELYGLVDDDMIQIATYDDGKVNPMPYTRVINKKIIFKDWVFEFPNIKRLEKSKYQYICKKLGRNFNDV